MSTPYEGLDFPAVLDRVASYCFSEPGLRLLGQQAQRLESADGVLIRPQATDVRRLLEDQGNELAGLGVPETMDVVQMVLGGLVNKDIVNLIQHNGGQAVGLTGKDGRLIKARKMLLKNLDADDPELQASEIIDIGHVGEVQGIDTKVLDLLGVERDPIERVFRTQLLVRYRSVTDIA